MALQEQSHLLSFSVERLLQQSRRHSKSSSTCESPSSTPPSSPPLLLSQPREIMVNAGVTALPLSFGMPLSSTTTWNPSFNAWSVLGLPMAYKPLVNSTWNFQPSSIQQQSLSLLNTKKKMDHTDIARSKLDNYYTNLNNDFFFSFFCFIKMMMKLKMKTVVVTFLQNLHHQHLMMQL